MVEGPSHRWLRRQKWWAKRQLKDTQMTERTENKPDNCNKLRTDRINGGKKRFFPEVVVGEVSATMDLQQSKLQKKSLKW